ncbi:MAG: BCCT family transporter [Rhodobacteraceae bacterium]|nr:BCCT family transporter [Paracoccaceae bacterium]
MTPDDHSARAESLRAQSGWLAGLSPTLALVGKGFVLLLVLLAVIDAKTLGEIVFALRDAIFVNLKWHYILLVSATLGFVVWLSFSRFGTMKLGDDDEKPEFSYASWIAMLFGAGMGIGLVFWSVAEPLTHYQSNPFIDMGGDPATTAMRLTFFHWGLHPWAIYATVGLALAYFAHRRKMPLTIRSTLYPLLGERVYGPWGHVIDLLSMMATLFGVATSLGLGVKQINTGLNILTGWDVSVTHELILIGGITAIAVGSVSSGLHRGIKWLSNWNMVLAIALLLFVFVAGPTRILVNTFVQSVGDYLGNIVSLSFWMDANGDSGWQKAWTTFYWGWWIAWAPFVGMFIARISRGRTIREFIFGVLVMPTLITFVWLALFGGTAFHAEREGADLVAAVTSDVTTGLYSTIATLASGATETIVAALATVLIVTFFVTSSDSGTLVINTLMSVGDPEPPLSHRVIWGVTEGAVAAVLLLAGGLEALQATAISAALPFSIILILMMIALARALEHDYVHAPQPALKPGVEAADADIAAHLRESSLGVSAGE